MTQQSIFGKKIDIDHDFEGWQDVDLCRRIRNIFTKTGIDYKPSKDENIKTRNKVIEYYDLKSNEYEECEIPTPINSVVLPMFESCKKYVEAKLLDAS